MDNKNKNFRDIHHRVILSNAIYATLLICKETLKNSDSINDALTEIDELILKLKDNNHKDFIEWIKRSFFLY